MGSRRPALCVLAALRSRPPPSLRVFVTSAGMKRPPRRGEAGGGTGGWWQPGVCLARHTNPTQSVKWAGTGRGPPG